ncbi:MAG: type II toxin-antitoxin system RelE/ParE family toxin [Gammaproteobacteria bacterium]|nr:type II toxin-antitoxin system RelE/ParE family toxin [Gammaproteobacteria bacterium]
MLPALHNPIIRERFIYSYRLIDDITATEIQVPTVIHAMRLLASRDRF